MQQQNRDFGKQMVGTGRFELPTPRTPSECSTRLSHVPTQSSRLECAGPWGSYLVYTSSCFSISPAHLDDLVHLEPEELHCYESNSEPDALDIEDDRVLRR